MYSRYVYFALGEAIAAKCVFHILDLRSKEAIDEQKGGFGNFNWQKDFNSFL